MPVLTPQEIQTYDIDTEALRIFLKALEILGGPRKLIEYRNLTWLPSLMEAAYAILLQQVEKKTESEIAEFLGLTKQTVRNILRANPKVVQQKLQGELQDPSLKAHIAGGLAKLAYQEIQAGRDHLALFHFAFSMASDVLGIAWPIQTLLRIKGLDFPAQKDQLVDRLKGITIRGIPVETLLEQLNYPVTSPADLLRQIRQRIESQTTS